MVYKDDAGDAHDAMASGSSREESEAEDGGMSQACCSCPFLLLSRDLLVQDEDNDSDAEDGDGGSDADSDADGDDDDDE